MERDRFVVGFPLGRWQSNCFVIGDRSGGTAVVVDPGEGAAGTVPDILGHEDVALEAVLLTHGHIDHLWAAPTLAERFDVPVLLHPDDRWLWNDPAAGFGGGLPAGAIEQLTGGPWDPPSERLEDIEDGVQLPLSGVTIEVRHSPGHTPGHCTFLVPDLGDADIELGGALDAPEPGVLFSGDLVFQGSIGRTDFPRGSYQQQMRSITRTFLDLEDETLVLTGHGPQTTVGRERRSNPFLRELVSE